MGDVMSGQTLNVVENNDLLKTDTQALGNGMAGGNYLVGAKLNSTQTLNGNVSATTTINGTQTPEGYRSSLGTPVYLRSQAVGNYGAFTTKEGNLQSYTTQTSNADSVSADTQVNSANNSIYKSGEVNTLTVVNSQAFEVTQGRVESVARQQSGTESNARTGVAIRYSPSPNLYKATAQNNYYSSNSTDRGSQDHNVTQTNIGRTEANTITQGGNVWDIATRAEAVANTVTLKNQGGAMISASDQTNQAAVQSTSDLRTDQFGSAYSQATSIGNVAVVGNEDKYLKIDVGQFNDGPIDATANFEGREGYDAYLNAEATGNSAMGYACAECQADMTVNNAQINQQSVSASTNVNITGTSRAIVSNARATGNTATYYVSGNRP
jgi:hypothetical protein